MHTPTSKRPARSRHSSTGSWPRRAKWSRRAAAPAPPLAPRQCRRLWIPSLGPARVLPAASPRRRGWRLGQGARLRPVLSYPGARSLTSSSSKANSTFGLLPIEAPLQTPASSLGGAAGTPLPAWRWFRRRADGKRRGVHIFTHNTAHFANC